jgi:hypothetical protein
MNESHLVTFLIHILDNLDILTEYSIEYGAALLMNLCLRSRGKQDACQNAAQTLKVLNELIDHDNNQVKTYVNGCLYSLFSEPLMRREAQKSGMESQLQYLKQNSDDTLARQIEFVITKLGRSKRNLITDDDEISDDESENDDDTFQEDEDDEDDEDMYEYDQVEPAVNETLLRKFIKRKTRSRTSSHLSHSTHKRKPTIEHRSVSDLTIEQLQSMQIQLPALESTKKGKLKMPITREECVFD